VEKYYRLFGSMSNYSTSRFDADFTKKSNMFLILVFQCQYRRNFTSYKFKPDSQCMFAFEYPPKQTLIKRSL